MKILLVEDDITLAEMVVDWLVSKNNEVDHLTNGTEGLEWLTRQHYSLAILDWELPGLSGVEVCKRYRARGGALPILMLTGRKGTDDIVDGLESGADDYLAKPFELPELFARIRALLRRPGHVTSSTITAGALELDPKTGKVCKGNEEIVLSRKEFAVLEYLMTNPGRIYSAEALLDRIWPTEAETSAETVRCHITRLRAKLASVGEDTLIKTVYGMGYKLEKV